MNLPRRYITASLCSLLCGIAVAAALVPWTRQTRSLMHDESALALRLERARLHAAEHNRVHDLLAAIDQRPEWSELYVAPDGQVPSTLVADLQSAMGKVASQATITSPVRTPVAGTHATLIGWHQTVAFRGTADALADSLSALGNSPYRWRISSLEVTSPATQRPDRNEPLEVTMEVIAFAVSPDLRPRP